jgi:sarcosine oxidase subunit alpha
MSGLRLPTGGRVDRAAPVRFTFDGKSFTGYKGDTLASALLANGVKLVGRSFKYHRPRGILTAGSEEPNALVEVGTGANRTPNTRATMLEIYEGLEAQSQNRFPSLAFDALSVNDVMSPFLSAGFYYKTFMWPASFWEKVYEPIIRRAAGLGRLSGLPDPEHYEKTTEFCDVLVIGGGPDGLAAARTEAASGARVILCDEYPLADIVDGVKVFDRTTVVGVYDHGSYAAVRGNVLVKIVASRSILATGALERPLVFGHNDKPGVMLASAVRDYVLRYGVSPGRNILLALNNDDAADLLPVLIEAGIAITAVIDSRPESSDVVRAANVPVFAGATLRRALGGLGVTGAEIVTRNGTVQRLACDVIATSGGFSPNVALTCHADGRPVWDEALCAFVAGNLPPGMSVIGKAAGQGINKGIVPLWHSGNLPGKSFVDFQNDVTVKDIKLADKEGFSSVEHVKRYTTLGMATDQGKTANVNALAILAETRGTAIAATGTTRYRPPYIPTALGVLAGAHKGKDFRPTRYAPTHEFSASQGAVFTETGFWLRAQYYPRAGEDWLAAAQREVNTVRNAVGICDVTTLGKIDIQGPDAAKFLEKVYTNAWSALAVGRARYGLMLREDGFAMDDGTCARLAETHYVMTTTTANAGKVMQHLEFCAQVLWPELDVSFISVTDQWAQVAVAGPRARDTLAKLVDADISNAALPYMGCTTLAVDGTPARLFRLSFSGELAYEVAVPARYGNALMAALMEAGQEFGIAPYGTEALGIMRIEKGHPAGPELNGQTSAHDLGMGKLLSKKKDFVGRHMAVRPALTDPARPTLVGLKSEHLLRAGSHLLPVGAPATAEHDEGWISSAAQSPSLGFVALGLLKNGPARHGETIRVYDPVRGGDTLATIVPPVHYDPTGSRLHA